MKFQFQATTRRVEEDSAWGLWIYTANVMRRVQSVLMTVVPILLVSGTVYVAVITKNMSGHMPLVMLSLLFCVPGVLLCVWQLIRRRDWKDWKKRFLQTAAALPATEDAALAVTFTEHGCVLELHGETVERFTWKQVLAVREWPGGWDFIECTSVFGNESAISVRKEDMIEGNATLFTAFIQQMSKKKCKPRAISLDELQRKFK